MDNLAGQNTTAPISNPPSYYTSTLSQLAVMSAVVFALGAIFCAIGLIWFKLPAETAKEVIAPFEFFLGTFGSAYLATRKQGS